MNAQSRLLTRNASIAANPPAPRIPDADNYGGIGRANVFPPPGRGTVVTVSALTLLEGDEVALYWEDPLAPVASIVVPPALNSSLSFDVPVDALRRYPPFPPEGTPTGTNRQVDVWYTIYRPFPEELFTSDKARVTVDWLVPGDPDPDPTTPYVNENLAPLVLPSPVPPGKDLALRIPRWKNAAIGDRLTLAWGSTQIVVATLDDTLGESGPAIDATVPWQVIDTAGDNIVATYYVIDAVSNHSLWATSVKPDVETGDRLPAPTILDLDDYDRLDADALAGGPARVEVRYASPLAGDTITLHWSGQTQEGIPLPDLQLTFVMPTPPPSKHTFEIPFAQVQALIGGRARAYYTTVPASGTPLRRSLSAAADVTGTGLSLPAPTVREANGATLDPSGTATVVVRTDYAFASPGDRIIMLWQGMTSGGIGVTEQQDKLASEATAGALSFTIPPAKVTIIAGGTVKVSYTVFTSANVSVESAVLALAIGDLGSGALVLPPPGVDGAVGGELDAANVGATINVRVPANPGFLHGDKVDVAWLGTPNDGTFIGANAKPADPAGVAFEVPRSVLLANIGRTVSVQYAFVGGAETPRLSDARTLACVDTASLPALPAPTIPQASGGSLDGNLDSATLSVPASAPLKAGDTVEGFFNGTTLTSKPATPGAAMSFTITEAMITAARGKSIVATYKVTRGSETKTSPALDLDVTNPLPTGFPAPIIAEASGGQLDGSLASATLSVPASAPLIAGDIVTAYFGTREGVSDLGSVTFTPGLPPRFTVTGSLIARVRGKTADAFYIVERGGKSVPSSVLEVEVTSGLPANLPAPTVPQASGGQLDGGLTSATLTVPASAPLNAGDTVEGFFDGKTLGTKPATPGVALSFTITSAMIVAARDKTVTVLYTVTRDGKPTASPTLNITVKDPMPSSFPAPRVPEAVGSSLDGSLASATLRVPATANLLTGDIVQAAFNGRDAGKKTVTTPGAVLNFVISQALIAGAAGRQVRVQYEVEREGKKVQSDVLTLTVTEGIEALPAPTVPESSSGQLDGGLTLATCRVPATAPLRAGDIVTGYFDAKDLGNRTVASPGTVIDLSINGAMITAARGRRVDVDYTVKRGTLVVRSVLANIAVTVPVPAISFGGDVTLNVGDYIVAEDHDAVYPPSSATYARTASGGTPPYSYTSNTTTFVTLDRSSGAIVARRNGTTRITATDAKGASASYALTTAGVKVMYRGDDGFRPWANAVSYCAERGGRLASLEEMLSFYRLYKPESNNVAKLLGWPAIQGHDTRLFGAWTSTKGPSNDYSYYFVNLNGSNANGATVNYGESGFGFGRPSICLI